MGVTLGGSPLAPLGSGLHGSQAAHPAHSSELLLPKPKQRDLCRVGRAGGCRTQVQILGTPPFWSSFPGSSSEMITGDSLGLTPVDGQGG